MKDQECFNECLMLVVKYSAAISVFAAVFTFVMIG